MDYVNYMSQYTETMQKMDELDNGEMTDAELILIFNRSIDKSAR